MSDKQTKKLIRKYFRWWTHWLGLRYGKLDMRFMEFIKDATGPDVAAVCHTDWRYQKTTIEFALHILREMNKKKIEEVVVHELMHIFLNEMREKGTHHEEHVATCLTNAFMWVKEGASK